ncbi:MAG: hypothetical protein JXR46_04255 [Calditrichaceae bacterium]|nr:hypothetical protein [Calditrichaceae bacterium]MBN2708239.1 hypothetical protein [Calditrichaceae bacterium]RQV92261.1 MAG: hypothetical protein EH224_16140 [Calditrichota bacterium]
MKKIISVSLSFLFFIYTLSCSSTKTYTMDEPMEQESVRITKANGAELEGIVVKQTPEELVFIDARTHNKETLRNSEIKLISKSANVYDFNGNPIPKEEIKEHKSSNKMLLYGAGGFLLGAAAGIGTGLTIISADSTQRTLANIAIGVLTVAGTVYFGNMGYNKDHNDAVFKARMARHDKEKAVIEAEKKKIDELKKEKEELLKKKEEKQK